MIAENMTVQLTSLLGDYPESDLPYLQEVLHFDYRGDVRISEEGWALVSFTFPRNGRTDVYRDGLKFLWVSHEDLAVIE